MRPQDQSAMQCTWAWYTALYAKLKGSRHLVILLPKTAVRCPAPIHSQEPTNDTLGAPKNAAQMAQKDWPDNKVMNQTVQRSTKGVLQGHNKKVISIITAPRSLTRENRCPPACFKFQGCRHSTRQIASAHCLGTYHYVT